MILKQILVSRYVCLNRLVNIIIPKKQTNNITIKLNIKKSQGRGRPCDFGEK